MAHPTRSVSTTAPTTALVLVGPPAVGKTTIREICSDYDVPGCDLAKAHEQEFTSPEIYQELIDETIAETSGDPGVCCIEGAILESEVQYVRNRADSTLVVRVETSDDYRRVERYCERELDEQAGEFDVKAHTQAELEAKNRHRAERPYPKHDVRLVNDEGTAVSELTVRCVNLIAACSSLGRNEFIAPADAEVEAE